MSTPDPRKLRWRDSTPDRTADRAGQGPGTTRGARTLSTSPSTLRGTLDTMLAPTVSRRATQGSILGGMETPASILDLTVKAKMGTLDSTLEGMVILDSILDQAVMGRMETLDLTPEEMENQGSTEDQRETNRMETLGSTLGGMVTPVSMLASLGVWHLVLQGSEPPSSLLRTVSWRM